MSQPQTIGGVPATTAVFIGLAVLFLIFQSFTVIQPGYRGVSVTLGKPDPNFRAEGLTLKWPFIEQITPVPVKQITVAGKAVCFSSDLQTVTISFKALYRIPESKVVDLFVKYHGDPYESLMEPRIQDSLKQVAALYRAEDLVKSREHVKRQTAILVRKILSLKEGVSADDVPELLVTEAAVVPAAPAETLSAIEGDDKAAKATKKAAAAPKPVKKAASNRLDSKRFNAIPLLTLVDLPISNIDLTDDLEHAIEQKQIKEQEALAKRYELDKARRDAEITVVNAEAEAKAVKIKGAALKSAPEVIELEIAKKWDGKAPTTVVVGKGGSNVLLPLR